MKRLLLTLIALLIALPAYAGGKHNSLNDVYAFWQSRDSNYNILVSSTPSYAGPCDVITGGCAEAYSVTRAMANSYHGPLLQLSNGTSTLDIGQDANRAADMTTWSAFCGGVASNCKISKIYAQIQGSANDLIPSSYLAQDGTNCTAGGLTCAAPFAIDSDTGLPIVSITSAPYTYVLASETGTGATGITGGTNAASVWVSGKVRKEALCCGVFGFSHSYNAGDTVGTDFILFPDYTNNYNPNTAQCVTDSCLGIDLEGANSPTVSYGAAVGDNANWLVAWTGSGTNLFSGYYNGLQLYNATGDTGVNVPTHVRLGGGGDLSHANIIFRSGLIANAAASQSDATAIQANESSFYAGTLTFKTLPATPISLVAHASGATSNGNSATTSSANTTGASLLYVAVSGYSAGTLGTLSDSLGNTWTLIKSQTATTNTVAEYYCCASGSPVTGSAQTFTISGTGAYPSIAMAAFSGTATSPLDGSSSASSASPGNISPVYNGEAFVSAISFDASSTPSVDSSFTITDTVNYVSGGSEGISLAYKIQTHGITQNPAWTVSGTNHAAAQASFHQ